MFKRSLESDESEPAEKKPRGLDEHSDSESEEGGDVVSETKAPAVCHVPCYVTWLQEHPEFVPLVATAVLQNDPEILRCDPLDTSRCQEIWGNVEDAAQRLFALRRWILKRADRVVAAEKVCLRLRLEERRHNKFRPYEAWLKQQSPDRMLEWFEALIQAEKRSTRFAYTGRWSSVNRKWAIDQWCQIMSLSQHEEQVKQIVACACGHDDSLELISSICRHFMALDSTDPEPS